MFSQLVPALNSLGDVGVFLAGAGAASFLIGEAYAAFKSAGPGHASSDTGNGNRAQWRGEIGEIVRSNAVTSQRMADGQVRMEASLARLAEDQRQTHHALRALVSDQRDSRQLLARQIEILDYMQKQSERK